MASTSPYERSSMAGAQYVSPQHKSGHLYKKSTGLTGLARSSLSRVWKARYFSLEGSVLYYYKREGDNVPRGIVVLTGCEIKTTRDKKYYSFRITHPKTAKVYDLAATLESRAEDWIDALTKAAQPIFEKNPTPTGRSNSIDAIPVMPEPSAVQSAFTLDESDLLAISADDAELPAEHKDELQSLMGEFITQAQDDAAGWKLQAEKRDCKVYVREASRLGSCKGVGEINHHPFLILKLLLELHRRESFDPQLQSANRAHVFDDHTFIDHLTYKPVFPASARDFLHVTHWRVLQNGSIIVIATSVDRTDIVPSSKDTDTVRARTVMGGFLITPNADYTGARAQYIVKADVGGGIPVALQTKMFVKQAFVIDGVRRALDEEEVDAELVASLPRVTNRTVFGITTSDKYEEMDLLSSTRSLGESTDTDDEGSMSFSSDSSIPKEGRPAVPDKYRELLDKAIARMDMEIQDHSVWNFHSEKNGVKAYNRVDGSLTAAMGVGHVPYSPRAMWEVIIDINRKKSYDSQLADGKRLAQLDAQTSIDYLEYKPVFVVSGRDFCNLVHWRVLPGGTIIIVAQSIEDLTLAPLKEPKVIRADLHISGWKIVPDADYKGCNVTFMVKTDLKGSIPSRITSKVAAEQPYMIYQLSQLLKKSKDLSRVEAEGPLTNTITEGHSSGSRRSLTASSKSISISSKSPVLKQKPVEPEAEAAIAPPAKKKEELVDVAAAHSGESSTTNFMVLNAVQFVLAIVALKVVSLPGVLHYGVVGYLAIYFITMLYMGPSHMTPRRKLMIASFGPPDSGMILGTLSIDVRKTQAYIAEKREKTGDHITITHIVLSALGSALAKTPSVNGHIVFGNYYPAPTVDISCLVAVGGGKDLGVCRLPACDKMSLKQVCARVRGDATKLRSGKDKEQDDRNKLMTILPTWVIRPIVNAVGWLGGCLGLRIKPVGVEPYMFGSVMVTSVGMMGLELAFAPITPYAQTPMLVTIGSIRDTPVVEDGQVVVRPMLMLTTTIDHRYVDGSQAARMASWMKKCIEDPSLIEPVDV